MAAARWLHACRERAGRELDSTLPAFGQAVSDLEECEACRDRGSGISDLGSRISDPKSAIGDPRSEDCAECGGLGMKPIADPRQESGQSWWSVAGEALRAYGLIEAYGVEGFLRMEGASEFDPVGVEAVLVIKGELSRLEHEGRREGIEASRHRGIK